MNEIESWLDDPNEIETGIRLFDKYSSNAFLKSIFKSKSASFVRPMLIKELEKIKHLGRAPKPKAAGKLPITNLSKFIPEELKPLLSERSELLQRRSYLRAQLIEYEDEGTFGHGYEVKVKWKSISVEQAKEYVLEVQSLSHRIAKIYDDLKHFQVHGTLPDPPIPKAPKILNDAQKLRRMLNLRTYVKRDPTSPKFDEWTKELEELERWYNEK
jgi:hypothetical protein